MRERIFRGKGVDNNEWVEGNLIRNKIFSYIGTSNEKHLVFPRTVSEFTGLCDRNGKRIFEGDIVMCIDEAGREQNFYAIALLKMFQGEDPAKSSIVIVERDDECDGFFLRNGKAHIFLQIDHPQTFDSAKVIGNKWDNPELLKEVSDV